MQPTLTRLPAGLDGLSIAVRHQAPAAPAGRACRAVLYVHGATFGSALSIFHPFEGLSWADTLARAGWHVWGFDQLGFGDSDRYREMSQPADANPPVGRADAVARQIHAVVRHVQRALGVARVSVVAHSWGTMAAALYATRYPENVDRLVLFAPITARPGPAAPSPGRAWHLVTGDAQWARFVATLPQGAAPVLPRRWFDPWVASWLATDAQASGREPPAVKIPYGPLADVDAAMRGLLPYEPSRVLAPTLIVRGEWDSWPTDADAQWLFGELANAAEKRDVKIGRGTHVMHLETGRGALYGETLAFLDSEDAPVAA